jgi:hypothetical protein
MQTCGQQAEYYLQNQALVLKDYSLILANNWFLPSCQRLSEW